MFTSFRKHVKTLTQRLTKNRYRARDAVLCRVTCGIGKTCYTRLREQRLNKRKAQDTHVQGTASFMCSFSSQQQRVGKLQQMKDRQQERLACCIIIESTVLYSHNRILTVSHLCPFLSYMSTASIHSIYKPILDIVNTRA